MLSTGPAKKLTIYIEESDRIHGKPVHEVLLNLFFERKIAGASVFRGIEGYGSGRVFHTAKILELSTSLPVRIEVVDTQLKIDEILLEITAIVHKGLITVSDTTVVKSGK